MGMQNMLNIFSLVSEGQFICGYCKNVLKFVRVMHLTVELILILDGYDK